MRGQSDTKANTKQMPENASQQSPVLPPAIQVNAGTRKAKPKTEFWRATETNRLTQQSLPKKEAN
ncbi:MAG: hypothetical protein Q8N96_07090 [Methylovulum sp.]|nr:hypothetical protein [Methylovulum sp.]